MAIKEIIIATTIHLIIPLIGLIIFTRLVTKMKSEIQNPPINEFLIIFITYGGLLLVLLTSIFWKWSALASLGTFYLILGAPIVLGIVGLKQFKKRKNSKYNDWAYQLSFMYFIVLPLIFLMIYLTEPEWIN